MYILSLYAAWPKKKLKPKKKSHTRWTAFSFDYVTHSLWHYFNKLLQCHQIYFHPMMHKVTFFGQAGHVPSYFETQRSMGKLNK